MKTNLWTNTDNRPVFKGGMRIQPGETRELPVHLIPAVISPSDAGDKTNGEEQVFSPADFLDQSLRDMEDAGLAELEMGQLTDLKQHETANQNRTNVLTSIDAALLKHAQVTAK